ncbi:hypothetical protein BDV96DRAFT_691469 [Lophiotrema nucula]|uniref:Uncharacterized protein n=1 Tax=Lophiotrema nucula TaxID=690887 RepID=A0A6A5YRE9_9PLEO|nr:hypothetical protein BDV96DRAFT_691469 [Lophiotrema nucula]
MGMLHSPLGGPGACTCELYYTTVAMHLSSLLLWLGVSSISIAWARVAPAPAIVTPAPSLDEVELRRRQASGADLGSLLPLLATAVPPSILALALTNVPAVSRLLWSEFLDDNTPAWFTALPTDVQAYLSGEFGPTTTTSASGSTLSSSASTTASATSSPSSTASANQANGQSSGNHNGGLPLWAKILIGVLVPLVVLGLLALLLCCCLRRRRHRRATRKSDESRAPTPAFISNSYRRTDAAGEQHVPLRGGYLSAPDSHHRRSDPNNPYGSSTSNSGDFHTPVGGPSYEDIPPATAAAGKHSRRSSRQSLSSLHSVPEVPEPTHRRNLQQGQGQSQNHIVGAMAIPHPPPPRSPRRSQSREFSSYDFNPADGSVIKPTKSNERRVSPLNPTYGGNRSSNGGHYAATSPYDNEYVHHDGQRHSNPFSDPSPPRHSGYMSAGEGYGGMQQGMRQEPELFMPPANGGYKQQDEYEWPLRSPPDNGRIRRKPVRNSG